MEVTKNWYRIIEDIIQCPVCLKITEMSYIHCSRGHHMCLYCVNELTKCPMCYNNILPNVINHLVANDLASKLGAIQLSITEDIKFSTTKTQQDKSVQTDLLITNSSVNTQTDETKLSIPIKLSVYTQTCDDYFDSPNNSNWRKQIVNKTHSYPCLMCSHHLKTYLQLDAHLHQNHAENLEKFNNSSAKITRSFTVERDNLPWECEYAISLCSRTIYFVNILLRSNGRMKCYVRFIDTLYPSTELSTKSYYVITIESLSRSVHQGKVKQHTQQSRIKDMYDICFSKVEIRSIIESTGRFVFTFSLDEINDIVK